MRALAFLVLSVALGGCNPHDPIETPTIPIPPPAEVAIELDTAAGTATMTIGPDETYADMFLYVFNLTQSGGAPVARFDATGFVMTDPFQGVTGDRVDITFREGDVLSGYCIVLRATPPALSDMTDLCP